MSEPQSEAIKVYVRFKPSKASYPHIQFLPDDSKSVVSNLNS